MEKYWFHEKNYDKSRYHLVKAIDDNYNNVNAKHLLVDVEDITENYSSAICYVNELLEVNRIVRVNLIDSFQQTVCFHIVVLLAVQFNLSSP